MRPVENVALTTKVLQERKTTIEWDDRGKMSNKNKLIQLEISYTYFTLEVRVLGNKSIDVHASIKFSQMPIFNWDSRPKISPGGLLLRPLHPGKIN